MRLLLIIFLLFTSLYADYIQLKPVTNPKILKILNSPTKQQYNYKNDPLYKEFLKKEQEKRKAKIQKEKIITLLVLFFVFVTLLWLIKKKLLPYINKNINSKKHFRLFVVISSFWVISSLIFSIAVKHYKWWFDTEMYLFLFLGLLPNVLFWSYYWIKSADK